MKRKMPEHAKRSLYQEISIKVGDNRNEKLNSADDIRVWLLTSIAQKMKIESDQIDDQEEFTRYVSSLEAMELLGDLERKLDRRLTPSIVTHYPNIAMLAEYLGSKELERKDTLVSAKRH